MRSLYSKTLKINQHATLYQLWDLFSLQFPSHPLSSFMKFHPTHAQICIQQRLKKRSLSRLLKFFLLSSFFFSKTSTSNVSAILNSSLYSLIQQDCNAQLGISFSRTGSRTRLKIRVIIRLTSLIFLTVGITATQQLIIVVSYTFSSYLVVYGGESKSRPSYSTSWTQADDFFFLTIGKFKMYPSFPILNFMGFFFF